MDITDYLVTESYAILFVCEDIHKSAKIIQVTDNVKDLLGYNGHDLLGKSFFTLIPNSLIAVFMDCLHKKFLQPIAPLSESELRLPSVLHTKVVLESGQSHDVDCAVHEINPFNGSALYFLELDLKHGNITGFGDTSHHEDWVQVPFRGEAFPFLHLSSPLFQDPHHANNTMLRFHQIIQSCSTVQECLQWYCTCLLAISGFDQVTLYQFGDPKTIRILLEQANNPDEVRFNPDRYKVAVFETSDEEWKSYVSETLHIRSVNDHSDKGTRLLAPVKVPEIPQRFRFARYPSQVFFNWMEKMGINSLLVSDIRCFGRQSYCITLHGFRPLRPTFACKKLLHVLSGMMSTGIEKLLLLDQLKMQNSIGSLLNVSSPRGNNTEHTRSDCENSLLSEDAFSHMASTADQTIATSLEAIKVLISAAKSFMKILEADAAIVCYKDMTRLFGDFQNIPNARISEFISQVRKTQDALAAGWQSTRRIGYDAFQVFSAFIYICLKTSGDSCLLFVKKQLHKKATIVAQESGDYVEFDGDPFGSWKDGGTLSKLLQVVLQWVVQVANEIDTATRHDNLRKVLLSSISQEVGRPVSSIIERIENLKDFERESRLNVQGLRHAVDVMKASSELLNDLLFLSRMRSGRFTLSSEPQNLSQFLTRFEYTMSSSLSPRVFRLCTVPDEVDVIVLMDARRLRQVLSNIIQLVTKFVDPCGELELYVLMSKSESETHLINATFRFIAPGANIRFKEIDSMFRDFEASLDVGNIKDLIGLGLPIANRLLKHMGGTIIHGFENDSRLDIEIPFEIVQPKTTENARSTTNCQNKWVLVADDNLVNQRLLAKRLQKDGYLVKTASNGLEAQSYYVERLKSEEAFGVVLMDIHMPLCSGVEATRLIREAELKAHISQPAIIIAQTGSISSDQSCRKVGMNGILTKPVDYTLLRQIMSSIEQGTFRNVWDPL